MELLTARKRKMLRNEGMIAGMLGIRTRVTFLDISGHAQAIVRKAIEGEIAKLEAIIREQKQRT